MSIICQVRTIWIKYIPWRDNDIDDKKNGGGTNEGKGGIIESSEKEASAAIRDLCFMYIKFHFR